MNTNQTDTEFLAEIAANLRRINADEMAYRTRKPKTISYAELIARRTRTIDGEPL